jgi:hypothetical protein
MPVAFVVARSDLNVRLVPLQKTVQWCQFGKGFEPQRATFVLLHNTPEPFPKLPRLVGHLVQLPWQCLFPKCLRSFSRHESHLAQPVQQTLTAVDPIDDRIC